MKDEDAVIQLFENIVQLKLELSDAKKYNANIFTKNILDCSRI